MLTNNQPIVNQESYVRMMKSAGSLSKLFSESESPFLVSRNVENAFCEAFGANNLGRDDCSADASLNGIGVGIKTFLHGNGKTLQKIAEFNKDSDLYRNKSPKELIRIVAELRNARIDFTKRTYQIHEMIYHCVTRKEGKILVYESPMDSVDIPAITNIKISNNGNTITFEDGLNEYSFNVTKSTLYKRFITNGNDPILEIDVEILANPYLELAKLFDFELPAIQAPAVVADPRENLEYVILPLFSDRGNQRHVPEKSGLNQWNAGGRKRNPNEVYIPIPKWIHNVLPNFFPDRDESFDLRLPDQEIMSAKVCQQDSKALMSNPNKALGEWLLRQVMDLEEGDLLTYEQLEVLGIDSVIVFKHSENHYSIDFREMGSYDQFVLEHTQNA
ncbi:restriction endonuclease PLD domain-containing protein [Peribacillus frigoritolerans]|uniref:restriction endonuclease PLD domain-containing protein n=1 Tax=Peribacillus frigoritolerans TaxID=450367 RepID=UPI001059CCC1|nr:restriction endonuclease PLD domain-containing protein [Peribacillus frigoritolerans]TDL74240.1 NgoFVII family restriction endonuclease [Peribacillus frigoritolerans]